jgi:class 3 adenylate cyclase
MGIPVENLFPGMEGAVTAAPPSVAPATGDDIRPIRAILFADCKGYSKLRDEDIARYTLRFLEGVRRMMDRAAAACEAPVECNTWGDGLFLAFTSIRAAGRFAIALRAAALRTGATLDLPEGVCLRIGLHAGPVSAFADPVTGRPNLAGANVAFAARIEPIVPENQICASEPFAALAADEGLDEFRFEYAGATEFAKGFGRHPLYRLLPR